MCIVFLYTNNSSSGKYKCVLASNRDEFYRRPAAQAAFWVDYPHVLAGQDLKHGVDGGVWLGITKYGHIGAITNLLRKANSRDMKRRGPLLRNFLVQNEDPLRYATVLGAEKSSFNGFNLIVGKVSKSKKPSFHFVTNEDRIDNTQINGIYCVSNGGVNDKMLKLVNGKQKFETILNENDDKEDLIVQLISLLEDGTRYKTESGEKAISIAAFPELTENLSSIFVKCPSDTFGTRTNTVILIDQNNIVTFVERTMTEPINSDDPKWKVSRYEYELEDDEA